MESRDYHKFNFLKENRDIKTSVVKRIEESIKEFGVIPGNPIVVDKDFNIIDGQHRFTAFKNLGLPVSYVIIEGDVIAKAMALNANQSQWQLIDYIRSYAEQNVDCYRKLLKFEEKYKFGMTASINVIRKGLDFKINPNAEAIAEFVLNLEQVPFHRTKDFISAISYLYRKTDAKQRKVIQGNILKTPRCANITDYITAFENILNYRKRGSNLIKL
jgi:hypothetical protein